MQGGREAELERNYEELRSTYGRDLIQQYINKFFIPFKMQPLMIEKQFYISQSEKPLHCLR